MVADLRLLLWLRGRQLRHSIDYWLGIVGYEVWDRSISNRLYGIYLGIFLSLWLLIMWSLAVYQSMHAGARLSANASDQLRAFTTSALPWLVLGGAVLLVIRALRSSPLVLDEDDLTYVAGAPVSRAAIVLVEFVRRCWQIARIVVPVATLVAVLLAHRVSTDEIGLSVIPSALVAIPVVGLVWGLAWLGGMIRLDRPALARLRAAWLAPLPLLLPALAVPAVYRWPGAVLTRALLGHPSAASAVGMAALAAGLTVALVYAGRRASLTVVAVESANAFRLPSLAVLGSLASGVAPVTAPRAPRRRITLGGRPLLGLPGVAGPRMLFVRGALVTLREPGALLLGLLGTIAFAGTGALLIVNGAPAQIWLVWLTLVIMRPPGGLIAVFAGDQSTPFLRQFLPVDNLTLLVADSALAFAVVVAVAVVAWALVARLAPIPVSGWTLGLGLAMAVLLALSQAAVLARAATWDPALARIVFVGLGFGLVLLIGEHASAGAAVVVAGLIALILAALVRGGHRVTAT
ncbi:MAG TPA: hypothetical protein VFN57_01695 [Thermomicrobiaceae bacterium]|nr:hypothetical protein [Thermomicrobiaceae bacterium]